MEPMFFRSSFDLITIAEKQARRWLLSIYRRRLRGLSSFSLRVKIPATKGIFHRLKSFVLNHFFLKVEATSQAINIHEEWSLIRTSFGLNGIIVHRRDLKVTTRSNE